MILTDALDIDAYGTVAEDADDSLGAMAEVEVDVGMADDEGLAVLSIGEDGRFGDALFLP